MPDVYTHGAKKLRSMLSDTGWKCGVEGRILKGRDPELTCIIDTPKWYGDIYIHSARELYLQPFALSHLALALVAGLVIGQRLGKSQKA